MRITTEHLIKYLSRNDFIQERKSSYKKIYKSLRNSKLSFVKDDNNKWSLMLTDCTGSTVIVFNADKIKQSPHNDNFALGYEIEGEIRWMLYKFVDNTPMFFNFNKNIFNMSFEDVRLPAPHCNYLQFCLNGEWYIVDDTFHHQTKIGNKPKSTKIRNIFIDEHGNYYYGTIKLLLNENSRLVERHSNDEILYFTNSIYVQIFVIDHGILSTTKFTEYRHVVYNNFSNIIASYEKDNITYFDILRRTDLHMILQKCDSVKLETYSDGIFAKRNKKHYIITHNSTRELPAISIDGGFKILYDMK